MSNKDFTSLLTKNRIKPTTGDERPQQQHYLPIINAFSRLTYESIYIINYETMGFEYVSENPLFLCGYTPDEVLAMGYDFYFKNVPESDLELLTIINNAGFDFYDKLPAEERMRYTITYDFHLNSKEGDQLLINHKLTPLFLNADNKIQLAMCVVSLSHQKNAGNIYIHKQGTTDKWELDTVQAIWRKTVKPKLNKRELEILHLHARGFSITEIAEKLFVVADTIKYYRRRIFDKLQVSNMSEALQQAIDSKIV
ncbi:LuxR C-terminal-related transcriptional regulator [Mucilaginibacter sp. RS28]|uniref:LuxR C-terminal-related transcriptional regulator n=1 Tax=Mucilaginibacter straminoryzae TaxID=2932774 RepID=A0A9X1X7Q1_9SPHI|nr:LuxR C-terminal-related transcriptional regulator [Mucilaginibacter straminoryzae]MCJ8211985.1 LuxR C-terminal-related transcriptional regulator [Mucilaginibacter straminoryzae]